MYTWRHNQVLQVVVEAVTKARIPNAPKRIKFLKEGERNGKVTNVSYSVEAWNVYADLKECSGRLPPGWTSNQRPDLVMWHKKVLILGELTVPWEDGIDAAMERKRLRYEELVNDLSNDGWLVELWTCWMPWF